MRRIALVGRVRREVAQPQIGARGQRGAALGGRAGGVFVRFQQAGEQVDPGSASVEDPRVAGGHGARVLGEQRIGTLVRESALGPAQKQKLLGGNALAFLGLAGAKQTARAAE